MESKLDQLEKAVSRVVRHISKLQKARGAGPPSGPPSPEKHRGRTLSELVEENRRFKKERAETRRRIKSIIKEIDKVKL